MGLDEKRKIKELQDVTFPERTKELSEICGIPIAYEVEWASFTDLESLKFLDNLSCHRTNMAFRVICADQLGKDSVKEAGLKTIKLKNVADKKDMKITFGGGVLEMHLAYALGASGMYSDNEIKDTVSKGL